MEKERLSHLVKSVQNGDEAAVTELYNTFFNDVYYYILKTLDSRNDPDLAADLTQDTFIEALQTIDKLQTPEAFPVWIRRIAYHRCTAYFRKRHELLADEQEDGSTIFDTLVEDREEFIPGEALDKEALKAAIQEMINSLPEEQRSAIMMRYFDELSVPEIAQIQGTTEGTVKSRLNYGRKSIKKAVESYEKKHDIKLHCTGIIPLLLWLFREQKRATTPTRVISTTSTVSAAGYSAKKTAVAAAKTAARITTGKIIAGIAAVAVVAGIGIGVSQINRTQPQDLDAPQDSYHEQDDDYDDHQDEPVYVSDISPDDFCGTWVDGNDRLVIQFQAITERYYFEYYPEDGAYFHFFAEFDPQQGQFFTPEGNSCGFVTHVDADGNSYMDWKETDNPVWLFTYEENTLAWSAVGSSTRTFLREGAEKNPIRDMASYKLEDYPLYIQKVGEYHRAIFSDAAAYSEELYPSLNTHMLNYYHWYTEEAYFFYALEDIDRNGTPELLISKGYNPHDGGDIIDLYSISGDSLVQYFENPYFGERVYLSVLSGGMLMESGSSGASSGGASVYQISEDGSSINQVANYSYYFADDATPPPEGPYMSYEEYSAALEQYAPYEGTFRWASIEP